MRSLQPGDPAWIGPYRILARLGAGGMGIVYLARSPGARLAALKLVRREFADSADFRERFRREVTAARKVSGLYTAPVLDSDADAPQPWFAAGYVPAPTLSEALASVGTLPESAVRALGAGLAEALQAIHGAGLVHRDLKPGNILLAEDGPKIIDFGIAKVADATQLTGTGAMIGTLAYMAPEQIAGSKDAGPPADVFSLAGVLVYAATGAKPFGERDSAAVLYEVMYEEPCLDGVPASLRGLLAACLAKDPAGRPTLESVLAATTPADPRALGSPALRQEVAAREAEANRVASEPVTAPPPPLRVDDAEAGKTGRRRILGLAAAVAVVGIGAGTTGWTLTRGGSKPAKPAPRGTPLAAAPPLAWTFTPPRPISGASVVLVADGVVLWGGEQEMYGVDADSGRQLWTEDKANTLYSGTVAHGSTFVVLGGVVGDIEDQTITMVHAPTGRTTNVPKPRGVSPRSVLGVVDDTMLVRSMKNLCALDLTSGEIQWEVPVEGLVASGAADQTGFYVSTDPSLAALDPVTGRKRWVHTWPEGGTRKRASLDIAVAGGRVFGNFGDTVQAIDAAAGTPVWSRDTDRQFDTVIPAGANVIFKKEVLQAYDQATGAPRWTLAGPEPFADDRGHIAATGDLVAAAFNDPTGPSQGVLVAGTDGRALWAHRGPADTQRGWEVAVSGSSVFATDHKRLYRFQAGR
ncbi:serine/threonine-protein kinase [Actinomadura sp. KC345]|uniref:serine/threonine-protein kinase n=1 Tax=Actinomadura sp. KC345 TaxID=2530371 RepID=UPI001405053B|nr:serine/threonine-protein kinase [Actinomadura sp. KC345]